MGRGVVMLLLLGSTGCGGAGLLLKSPAESQCTEAGLRGCPEIAEGLVAFVEGDKAKGQQLLAKGAAENAPAELRQFADVVVMLGQIPGASQYAGPVLEVAEVLRSQAADGPSAKSGQSNGRGPGHGRSAASAIGAVGATPFESRRAGNVMVANATRRFPCVGDAGAGICTPTAVGPLLITDVSFSPECGSAATLASLPQGELPDGESAKWSLFSATSAGAWPVTDGEWLVLRVEGEGRDRCVVSWAGYVPDGSGE